MLHSLPSGKSGATNSPSADAVAALPKAHLDFGKVALLLNRNARRVSDRLARRMERIVGIEHLFYSRSLDDAEMFAREIVQRGYGTVVCGGGDGTLIHAVNLVQRYVAQSNHWRAERWRRHGERQALLQTPRFAFLQLGTGNGMRRVVGSRDPLADLRRIVDFMPGLEYKLPLIESDGERFVIAGCGYDSLLLNDYNWLKKRTHSRLLKPFMHSVIGYFVALFARTLPRILLSSEGCLELHATNLGRAYYLDPRRGDAAIPINPGETLFEGRVGLIGVATIPYYGYGFRAFPFSNIMPGMMHLRLYRVGPFRTLAHLPSLWRGTYRNPHLVHDFLVENVHIACAKPFPFQHSGDDQGLRAELQFHLADEGLRLLDFYRSQPHGELP